MDRRIDLKWKMHRVEVKETSLKWYWWVPNVTPPIQGWLDGWLRAGAPILQLVPDALTNSSLEATTCTVAPTRTRHTVTSPSPRLSTNCSAPVFRHMNFLPTPTLKREREKGVGVEE